MDILGLLAFAGLMAAQFTAVVAVARYQQEEASHGFGRRTPGTAQAAARPAPPFGAKTLSARGISS